MTLEKKGDYTLDDVMQDWRCWGSLQSGPDTMRNVRHAQEIRVLDVRPIDGQGYILNYWGSHVSGSGYKHLWMVLKKVPVKTNKPTPYICSNDRSHVVPVTNMSNVTHVTRFVPVSTIKRMVDEKDLLYTDASGMQHLGYAVYIGQVTHNEHFDPNERPPTTDETNQAAIDMSLPFCLGKIEVILDVKEEL